MNSNDRLTKMYNNRDRVVNRSRSNSLKEYHRKQKEQKRTRSELFNEIRTVWEVIDLYDTVQELYETYELKWVSKSVIEYMKYQIDRNSTVTQVLEHIGSYYEDLDLI